MPGTALTVSVLCVCPGLFHVCFFREKNMCFVFYFVSSSSMFFFTFKRNQTCMF